MTYLSGVGIGGLTLAVVLSKHFSNIEIDIYEAKSVISTIGVEIAIWKRSWQVLQDMCLDEEMKKRGLPPPHKGEAMADALVGADGVHSLTRATMHRELAAQHPSEGYEKYIEPIWSGTHAYRCTVNLPKFKELYPAHQAFSHPKISYSACFYTVETGESTPYDGPWVTDVSPEEVISVYDGWEPDLVQLLECLEKPSRWTIHVVRPIPFYVSGLAVLLGDAAHAMTPHQGVGGSQAIEDAYILGRLLVRPRATLKNLPDVQKIYQKIRLPFAAKAAERSRTNGLIYEFIHLDLPVGPNASAVASSHWEKSLVRPLDGWQREAVILPMQNHDVSHHVS
ncbi:hypothetical protein M422DRAFT_275365 [Sphaerobolus stellatus SS14]|uniref:FAD-binding domain-containing protein n=1 Tax=Sphaerobolus stellatus (strain SS14) TaxID=990650 RepID=A0A0C9U4E4_SPHS4|nr:hypothetical protein M422DRAFT_275365 [Sphaerobolus stellatus SS14]